MEDLNNSNVEPQINSNELSNISDDGNNSLSGIFGYDDNNSNVNLSNDDKISNDEPADTDNMENKDVDTEANSITYYTSEELQELGKPENADTIDINRIPPDLKWAVKLFQRPYTLKNQKLSNDRKLLEHEKEEFEKSKLSFHEELEAFRSEQERYSKQDILDTGRLSKQDEKEIINVALSKTQEYLGEDFDSSNAEHVSIYNGIKDNITSVLYSKRVNDSMSNRLLNKYGDDFVVLERAVHHEFKNMPYSDSISLIQARKIGRYDIVEKFYDSVYNKLINKVKTHQNNNIIPPADNKPNKFPPNTVTGQSVIKTSKSSMYDTTGIL